MGLNEQIGEEMKAAMKAKDKVALESLRAIKSAILLAKSEKGAQAELTEDEELKLLQRLQKQRKDSIEIYEQQNRAELAAEEKAQLQVIEKFLPAQMSEAELDTYLIGLRDKLGVSSPQEMGKMMGIASKELAGKADGKTIAARVKDLLNR